MSASGIDTTATAIYEQGVLRLLSPISLPEHARVRLVIRPIDAADQLRLAERVVVATGLVTPPSAPPAPAPGSEERLAAIALHYAVGGPVSELIIAERDER